MKWEFDGGGAFVGCECGAKLDIDTNDEDVYMAAIKAWASNHEDNSFTSGVWHRATVHPGRQVDVPK